MSIISNWTNPFRNTVSKGVVRELETRKRFLSAVSRTETGKSDQLNQIFSPITQQKDSTERALEWVYQKMAYAYIHPIKLQKKCDPNTGDANRDNSQRWRQFLENFPEVRNTHSYKHDDVRKWGDTTSPTLTRKKPEPLIIEKIPAGFFISTRRFVDKNGKESGVIEKYGDDLYSVPQLYKDSNNKIKSTIENSPYRPTVVDGDPSVVLTSLSIVNDGVVGSVLRAKMNIKVFTKEALNVIDEWLLRPGNEVDIYWGWSTAAAEPGLNKEFLNAVVFNFSCEFREDNTWDVSIEAIAKGSLVTGVSFEVQDNYVDTSNTSQTNTTVPNLQGLIKLELAELQPYISASMPAKNVVTRDGLTTVQHLYVQGTIYKSNIFPHGIAQFVHPIAAIDDPLITYFAIAGTAIGGSLGAAGGILAGAGTPASVAFGIGGGVGGAYLGSGLFQGIARMFVGHEFALVQKTYICLSDIVHYFNTVLSNEYFPRNLDTFEIQVENSPTSYDPNLVSSDPLAMMFSDNTEMQFNRGMSTYGYSNRKIQTHDHGNITSFYWKNELKTWEDCITNHENRNPNNSSIKQGNLGHIWISTDFVQSVFISQKLDRGVDPRFKNIFTFFEEIFKLIAKATGGAIKPTFIQRNLLGSDAKGSKNIRSVIWIVDTNYMESQGTGTGNKYVFEVNNVNATLLRNINMRLKLPGSMQSTAYTFGRAGLNENIQTIDDVQDSCYDAEAKSKKDNLILTRNALERLSICKELAQFTTADKTVLENLQSALYAYVGAPTKPININNNQQTHQGWIFSRLYPAELSFELDGISGLKYGNMIKVKDALPSRYFNQIYFTITKLEHTITNHDWKLNVTAIARIQVSENQVGYALNQESINNLIVPLQDGTPPPITSGSGQPGQ